MAMTLIPSFAEFDIVGSIELRRGVCQIESLLRRGREWAKAIPRCMEFSTEFSWLLLFGLPDKCPRLRQSQMRKNAVDELLGHLCGVNRMIIESGNHREDDRSGFCG